LKRGCLNPAKNEGKQKPRFLLSAVEKGHDGLFQLPAEPAQSIPVLAGVNGQAHVVSRGLNKQGSDA
jgi:hypothetical protein